MLAVDMSIAVFTGKWNDAGEKENCLPIPPAFSAHRRTRQLMLGTKAKSLFLTGFLSLPCAWLATSIADNTHVPDALRYVFSPGTMLATHLIMRPSHSWQEMFEQLGHWATIALLTNVVFYAMLVFGSAMIFFAVRRPK